MFASKLRALPFCRRFSREEDGVAYIVFGMCLALFAIVLLGVELSLGATHASHEEKVSKLNEYATFLSKEYGSLWKARAACEAAGQTANCQQNGDATARVFTHPFSYYGALGDGNSGDALALAEMATYIQTSFNSAKGNNTAGFRFQDIISQSVTRDCYKQSRIMLHFEIKAKQYSWFIKNDRDVDVRVDRLTDIPCNASSVTPQPSGSKYSTPPLPKSACTHAGPRFETFAGGASSYVDHAKVRSLVNFVMSTDAQSAQLLGDTNYVQRFGASLRGLSSGVGFRDGTMSGGVTIGNFPVGGNGVPKCQVNGSGLVSSAGCYDSETEYKFASGLTKLPGIENGSRKGLPDGTVLTGEMRAQYTRHCPASQAVWTYRTTKRGDCTEMGYDYMPTGNTGFVGFVHQSNLGNAAYRDQLAQDFKAAHSVSDLKNHCTGLNSDYVDVADVRVTGGIPADETQCTDTGTGAGDSCQQFSYDFLCVTKKNANKFVFGGEWSPACRSEQLGADANAIYTSPDQLVKFRGKLVADLYNKPYSTAKIEIVGTPVKASATTMRAVDSDLLEQVDELQNLHKKNTERAFWWACDAGPQTDGGTTVANNGNLTKPYGVRIDDAHALLDVSGTVETALANSTNPGNGKRGCTIPALPNVAGKMTDTVASYDINFKRDNCTGPLCDIPEGQYAITLEPGARRLEKSGLPAENLRFPAGGLQTTWRAPEGGDYDGRNHWAWDWFNGISYANVQPNEMGNGTECPRHREASGCDGGYLAALDGTQYCRSHRYDTVQNVNAVCNGGGCQNIVEYILAGSDRKYDWPESAQEHLNVGAIAMERRLIEVGGQQTPYTCMLDKGETTTSQRNKQVFLADGGSLNCDWKNQNSRFFCAKGSNYGTDMVTPDEVEQPFIDVNGGKGGVFSFTADTLSGPVAIGDDKEEFVGSVKGANNFLDKQAKGQRLFKKSSLPSEIDPALTIVPVPVQSEETVHYRNSDDTVINYEMEAINNQVFDARLQLISDGYKGYDIFPIHRGNQCALFKHGVRMLKSDQVDDGAKEGSKFAVFIGALPSKEDYTTVDPVHLASQKNPGGKPGDYDSNALHMRAVAQAPDPGTDPSVAFIKDCIGSVTDLKVSATTTPFIITTLPPGATNAQAVLDAMKAATQDTTNETCKRPYCLLSSKEKDGTAWGLSANEENVLTPETCAAKLWKCITPPDTK